LTNTIYLVRHGENLANITREFSHKLVDYSLTPKGIQQAQQTATYFKDKNIHELYTSPLKRARETADIIAQELKLPVTVIEQFREINVGQLERQPPTDENWELHNAILRDWIAGRHETTFVGGEDYVTLLARMRTGLQEVTRDKHQRNIVVVGHVGIFMRTLRDICSNLSLEQVMSTKSPNCSITEIELATDDGQMRGTLKHLAYCAHLNGYAAELTPGGLQFAENDERKEG
jgi:broad specificity phosphatase PhoE